MSFSEKDEQSLNEWVKNSVRPNTAEVYKRVFEYWLEWFRENGPEDLKDLSLMDLVDYQKGLNRSFYNAEINLPERKRLAYTVLDYVDTKNWRTSYQRKIYSTVKCFFDYHLGENAWAKLSNGEKHRLKGRRKTRKELTIEVLRDIIYKSNKMYRAVFSCMFCSGMGIGELVKWSNQGIGELHRSMSRPIWVEGVELIEINLGPRKLNMEGDFYVYIGGSSLENLRTWLDHRDIMEKRDTAPRPFPDSIFIGNTYKPLTRKAIQFYWMSKLKQLGKWESNGRKTARTNMNTHQIRSLFRTRFQKSDADNILAEYHLGHRVDPLDYNQIHMDRDYRITEYVKALPWLDITKLEIEAQSERTREIEEELKSTKDTVADQQKQIEALTEEIGRHWSKNLDSTRTIDEKEKKGLILYPAQDRPPQEPSTRAELEAFRKRIRELEEKISKLTKNP